MGSNPPPPVTGPTPGDPAGDASVRPKFSRRPASFSRGTPQAEPLAPAAAAAPADTVPAFLPALVPAAPAERVWQEDARFGAVMLVLVLLVNIALVYGLPLLPVTLASSGPTQVTAKSPTMPDAIGRANPGSSVTLYSQPAEERRTIYLLDLRNTSSEQDRLSVSPYDTPPPEARALDDHEGDGH